MPKAKKLFFTWNDSEQDPSYHHWAQHESIADAVSNYEGTLPAEVFEATLKPLGFYEARSAVRKVKAPKKKEEDEEGL